MTTRVCVGAIVGVHGVRGAVKVKSFTELAADLASYGPVESEDRQHRFQLKITGESKGLLIVTLDNVKDRNAAEALRGTKLYVSRHSLPETAEDEFLYADLVGLRVRGLDGADLGVVRGIADFGAGDVLDIARPQGSSFMIPFTKAVVPVVDVAGGHLVVDLPDYAPDEDEDEQGTQSE